MNPHSSFPYVIQYQRWFPLAVERYEDYERKNGYVANQKCLLYIYLCREVRVLRFQAAH